jgi:hypothetical protein
MMPGPGGPDAAGGGVWPPVGGPFCAIASEVPPTSSAMIARLFTAVIVTSNAFEAALHPDTPMETRLRDRRSREWQQKHGRKYEQPLIFEDAMWQ